MMAFVRLESVAHINPRCPRDLDETQAVSFLAMASVSEEGQVPGEETRTLADTKKGYTYFERGDVLLAKITPCFENGKAAYLGKLKHRIGFGSTEFHVIRPIDGKLDPKYLFYLVWCDQFRFYGQKSMTGAAGQKRVSSDFLKSFKIPLPPLPEQRRIAAILDKADAIRRKRQQAIRLTEEFLRSVFLDMFGDPVLNPKGWEVKEMGDLLEFLTSGSRGWAKYYKEQGRPFLRIQNVGENGISLDDLAYVVPPESAEARRTKVKAGDVLLSITADLGRTGVVPDNLGETHINQHLALIRLNQGVPLYISAFLASDGGQRQFSKSDKGGVKAGLNFDDIRSIKVLFPPLPEQEKWACFYKRQQGHIGTLRTYQGQVESLFNSLVQRAFRGDL